MKLATYQYLLKITFAILISAFIGSSYAGSLLSEVEQEETIKVVADELHDFYVYPKIAARMEGYVLKRLEEGAYSAYTSAGEFAKNLTKDLQYISNDKHLTLVYKQEANNWSQLPNFTNPPDINGFVSAEVLSGNIGFIKFNMFQESKEAMETASAMLEKVAGSAAVIFDLRDNIGGSPRMVEFISSYFFEEATLLNSFYDRNGEEAGRTMTYQEIPGKRFSNNTPVYLLTSAKTFSAAEGFAYHLQSFKRGLVVGETTLGGAHPVAEHYISGKFSLRVPFLRAYNPITKTNWEGVGVQPDLPSRSEDALDTAIKHFLAKQ